jgi:membrane associated rhomboid family serine protease
MGQPRQMQPFIRPWQTGRPSITTLLMALSVTTAAVQLLCFFLDRGEYFQEGPILRESLALSLTGIRHGYVWQFVSYAALHWGPLHLLANLIALYFVGFETEPIVGRWHFFGIFAAGNVLGGIGDWLAMASGLAPGTAQVFGISAGNAAALAAFAAILPDLDVSPLERFGIFFRVRARMIGIAAFGSVLCLWASGAAPEAGAPGMFVGMFVGWVYIKALGYGNPLAFQRFLYRRRQRAARVARMPAEQFIAEEIDPILEKISREGMHSLTRAERKILAQGREKIATRV